MHLVFLFWIPGKWRWQFATWFRGITQTKLRTQFELTDMLFGGHILWFIVIFSKYIDTRSPRLEELTIKQIPNNGGYIDHFRNRNLWKVLRRNPQIKSLDLNIDFGWHILPHINKWLSLTLDANVPKEFTSIDQHRLSNRFSKMWNFWNWYCGVCVEWMI